MSYTKTQWVNDQAPAINATNLNKIEQGIYDNDSAIATNTTNISTNTTNIGDLTTLTTTANTDLVSAINEVNAKSEIDNTYGTSQTKGYSQNYANTTFATKDVATTSIAGLMSSSDKTKLDNIKVTQNTDTSVASQYITQGGINVYEYGKIVIILFDILVTTNIPANTPFVTGIPLPIVNTQGTINGPEGLVQGIVARRSNTQAMPSQTVYSPNGMQVGFYNGQIVYFKE